MCSALLEDPIGSIRVAPPLEKRGELIMTWLGGVGTLIGPLIGGAVLMTMADFLSSLMKNWLIFFGVLYIIVVLWAPNGLWGIVTRVGRSQDK